MKLDAQTAERARPDLYEKYIKDCGGPVCTRQQFYAACEGMEAKIPPADLERVFLRHLEVKT